MHIPGDKSISHRAALVAARAGGRSRITNFSTADDCAATLSCLRQLGVRIEHESDTVVVIEGVGAPHGSFIAPAHPLDCKNSGTTMRLLAGVLAAQDLTVTLTGDASLCARPMRRIIEPLERMGARVRSHDGGRAPLQITGRKSLAAICYELPVASAQVKSCVLFAGLGARGRTQVIERDAPTRDHTERMLDWVGADVETHVERTDEGETLNIVSINGAREFAARDLFVPGDVSSAAFLIAAAALLPRSELRIVDVGLNPTRVEFLNTLRALGADVRTVDVREECNETIGDIEVSGGEILNADNENLSSPPQDECHFVISGARTARLIDELPLLAVVGTQIEGGLEIRDAAELRFKETDRIRAMVENLRRMNAEVEERADGLRVMGRARLRGARLDACGDHRIAMACTVAALLAETESEIVGAECVSVSFPEFFALLDRIVER